MEEEERAEREGEIAFDNEGAECANDNECGGSQAQAEEELAGEATKLRREGA